MSFEQETVFRIGELVFGQTDCRRDVKISVKSEHGYVHWSADVDGVQNTKGGHFVGNIADELAKSGMEFLLSNLAFFRNYGIYTYSVRLSEMITLVVQGNRRTPVARIVIADYERF